jgi:hypothetical protein
MSDGSSSVVHPVPYGCGATMFHDKAMRIAAMATSPKTVAGSSDRNR